MCGIFGVAFADTTVRDSVGEALIEELFQLSESRGKEAAGLAYADSQSLTVFKTPTAASLMLRSGEYKKLTKEKFRSAGRGELTFVGHSRLVTDGVRDLNENNQPVRAGNVVGVHNGIVVNNEELWGENDDLVRRSELDSEIIFALLQKHQASGKSLGEATAATFDVLDGAASIAALFRNSESLLLATNTGSLYYRSLGHSLFVFASEGYILRQLAKKFPKLAETNTVHLKPGEAVIIDTQTLATNAFALENPVESQERVLETARSFEDRSSSALSTKPPRSQQMDPGALLERFPYESMRDRLTRCTRCVLPETMPFVDFDASGVCSYCRNYPPIEVHGQDELERLVAPHRSRNGEPDCIVGVSGGRDSIYGLHYIKRVLGMNPIAYTYDWGMVTDLARRNISRICGRLGIEHILVSADIPRKREFVRKNVEAWLARPTLGTIPLFMAGDKAYFHHLKQTKTQAQVELSFLCENLLERTDFKTGFAGVAPFHDQDHVYTLPATNKLKLLRYYSSEFLANPKYLNSSIVDTAKAFVFYYLMDRKYLNPYRYVMWNEEEVESTLFGEYDFELAEDTKSSWRIGDGTAAFYNYIYYAVAGMTENDTFRSNQIRNGAITREEALDRIDVDNRPRFQSLQWYLETIRCRQTLPQVLETINRIPKLY